MGTPRNFGEYAQALRSLARVPAQVASDAAPDIERDWRSKLAAGQDPYGNAYAALREASLARGRRPPPLHKYAEFAHIRVLPGAGLAMIIDHEQAGFHQTGTSRMVKRIVLPNRGVPAAWKLIIKARMNARIRETLGAS